MMYYTSPVHHIYSPALNKEGIAVESVLTVLTVLTVPTQESNETV